MEKDIKKSIESSHLQKLTDITISIRLYNHEPTENTFKESAFSHCGSLLTDSMRFSDKYKAFENSEISMNDIAIMVNLEIEKRIS